MSFSHIEAELKKVRDKIKEINESIKQLVIQMQLLNMTFERMLKPKQKREYKPIEIKLLGKTIPNSDDENYIKRYQQRLLKDQEESLQKMFEEKLRIRGKDKQEESE